MMYFLNGGVTSIQLKSSYEGKTICDVEHVTSSGNDNYYIFDVMVYMGDNLTKTPTQNRVSYIDQVVAMSESHIKKKVMVSLTTNFKNEITTLWQNEQSHGLYEVDGLIFTPKNGLYRSMKSWKWKPLSHMSIDFLVKKCPSTLIGIHPYDVKEGYTLMFLFSGINKVMYDKFKLNN